MARPKITISTGARFGKLVAIGPETRLGTHYAMTCQCDCGAVKVVTGSNLRTGQSKSCGCLKLTEKYHNLIGKRFGQLTVLGDTLRVKRHRAAKCLCSCGKEYVALIHAMVDGGVVSCGCHRLAALIERSTIHGASKRKKRSPEYGCWQEMRKRCLNVNHPSYQDYGGRGIKICERWSRYANFIKDIRVPVRRGL